MGSLHSREARNKPIEALLTCPIGINSIGANCIDVSSIDISSNGVNSFGVMIKYVTRLSLMSTTPN